MESYNSSYCEGVAALLQRQFKKILRVYNYSFACSEGLEALQGNRVLILTEITHLKRLYDANDYDAQSEALR